MTWPYRENSGKEDVDPLRTTFCERWAQIDWAQVAMYWIVAVAVAGATVSSKSLVDYGVRIANECEDKFVRVGNAGSFDDSYTCLGGAVLSVETGDGGTLQAVRCTCPREAPK